MSPQLWLVGALVLGVAVVALFSYRVIRRRRLDRERSDAERDVLEARVAERVGFLTNPPAFPEEPEPAVPPIALASPTPRPAEVDEVSDAPARMLPIPAPAAEVRPAGLTRIPAPPAVETPSPVDEPPLEVLPASRAMEDARPATTIRERPPAAPPTPGKRRRLRVLRSIAGVVVLALVLVVGAQALGGRLIGGPTPVPTATQLAVQPTATPAPTASAIPTNSPGPAETASPTPPATSTLTTPANGTPLPTPRIYVVESGDTLWRIARDFRIALDLLIAANPQVEDPNVILPGEQVTIPTPTPAP